MFFLLVLQAEVRIIYGWVSLDGFLGLAVLISLTILESSFLSSAVHFEDLFCSWDSVVLFDKFIIQTNTRFGFITNF